MMEHRIEEADGDRPAFCSRCGTDKLFNEPCPAISDGEMYKRGNAVTPQSEAQPASEKGMEWRFVPVDPTEEMEDAARPLWLWYAGCRSGSDWTLGKHNETGGYKLPLTEWEAAQPHLPKANMSRICWRTMLSAAPRALPAVGEILASHLDLQKLIEGGECKPTELAMVAHRHRATLLQQNASLTAARAEAEAENGDLWDGLKRACENCEAFDWENYRDGFDVEDAVGFLKQDHNDLVTALAEERAKGERMRGTLEQFQ